MVRSIALIFLFAFSGLDAQTDTSIVIQEVTISEESIRNTATESTSKTLQFDPHQLSLVELLDKKSNIYLKNYGAGSLSTPSIRGGSAGQTLVLWNGLPLHSPMLGLLDLSLIPSTPNNRVSITSGGSSVLWGSGAVSGLIKLQAKSPDSSKLSSSSKIGSFGTLGQRFSIALTNNKWKSSTVYSHESSDRDFAYRAATNQPLQKQTNAKYHRNHLMQDIYFAPNLKHHFAAHLWAYEASTEIPATTVQNRSLAYQEDKAIRSVLTWKYKDKLAVFETKLGHFLDFNDFYNPAANTEALNRFNSTFIDINFQRQLGTQVISAGLTYNNTIASSAGYGNPVSESRLGIFVSHLVNIGQIEFQSSLRQEFIDSEAAPFLPSIHASYRLASWLSGRAKITRDFRFPTLNDRYWQPGGDLSLLPESGWSQELGFDAQTQIKSSSLSFQITTFNRDMTNWIMWTPSEIQAFWTAKNINKVKSWGIETNMAATTAIHSYSFSLNFDYSYTNSTFQTSLNLPKVNAGDQLLYTPKHQGKVALGIANQTMSLKYLHGWTGSVTGATELVPSFHIGNMELTYALSVGKLNSSINLSINNIWAQKYYVIERRPVPGRNFNIAITFT